MTSYEAKREAVARVDYLIYRCVDGLVTVSCNELSTLRNLLGITPKSDGAPTLASVMAERDAALSILRSLSRSGKCENFTSGIGACFKSGRITEAEFGEDQACTSCICHRALGICETCHDVDFCEAAGICMEVPKLYRGHGDGGPIPGQHFGDEYDHAPSPAPTCCGAMEADAEKIKLRLWTVGVPNSGNRERESVIADDAVAFIDKLLAALRGRLALHLKISQLQTELEKRGHFDV